MRARRRGLHVGRVAGVLLLLLAAILVGAFIAKRAANSQTPLISAIVSIFNPVPEPQKLFRKDRLAILLLGVDYNYDARDMAYSAGARSDTIMAISLDLPSHSLHVLSVPRDMKYRFEDGHSDKINTAFSLGGPRAAERAVANFLGLPGFDRYVVLRLDATKALIDAIGGIDVPVSENMNYDDSWGRLHIHFTPGMHHMNGDQAVGYSRFRHDACSDPCRIKRQQQVLRITIAKLKNDHFNDLLHIHALMDVVNKNVITNLSPVEKLSLAEAYAGFNPAALKTEQVPYLGDEVLPQVGDVLLPDAAARAALVQRLFLEPTALASVPGRAALALVDPGSVHIDLQNGSGVTGLAESVAERLRAHGFLIDAVGNAASANYAVTEIQVAGAPSNAGERVRDELGLAGAKIVHRAPVPGGAAGSRLTVILGADSHP